jgi:hypothetical protein
MEVVKNSKENSENKRCYANTSYDPPNRFVQVPRDLS